MARIHLEVICETEKEKFLSEKAIERGVVTLVTLTSYSGFAAKNYPFMTGKLF